MFQQPSLACAKGKVCQIELMKKQKPSIACQMWWVFAIQFFAAMVLTALFVGGLNFVLHLVENTNRSLARGLPVIGRQIQMEHDPVKLRQKVNDLLQGMVSDGEFKASTLHSAIDISWIFGLYLCSSSLGYGIFAYRLQRETRSQSNPSS